MLQVGLDTVAHLYSSFLIKRLQLFSSNFLLSKVLHPLKCSVQGLLRLCKVEMAGGTTVLSTDSPRLDTLTGRSSSNVLEDCCDFLIFASSTLRRV
jgi:hypothetical protein